MLILSLQGLLQNLSLETILVCIVVLCFPHNITAGIHLYDECKKSNAPSVCHKILSISLKARPSLFTDTKYQVSQYEPNTDISEQFLCKL